MDLSIFYFVEFSMMAISSFLTSFESDFAVLKFGIGTALTLLGCSPHE
jgi:hypothetical protein